MNIHINEGLQRRKTLKKILMLIGVLSLFLMIGFLNSWDNIAESQPYIQSTSVQKDKETSIQLKENSIPTSFDYIFEERKEVDDFIVETYREYEIYEDEDGNIIKKVPTSNYDHLKYKNYNSP